ncbi:hypothetical protein HDV05_000571 [Chytridiales sp. JEL 0842]|nr:hypothetical protein HDV05_000571 [Chytridiales sp. JEL 0842]
MVDFKPITQLLSQEEAQDEENRNEDGEEPGWGLKSTKSQILLAKKIAREQTAVHRARFREAMGDPIRRLRAFYRQTHTHPTSPATPQTSSSVFTPRFISRRPTAAKPKTGESVETVRNVVYEWDVQSVGGSSSSSHEMERRRRSPLENVKLPKLTPEELEPVAFSKLPATPVVDYMRVPFKTDPGVTLLLNNYVAHKVVGHIPPQDLDEERGVSRSGSERELERLRGKYYGVLPEIR